MIIALTVLAVFPTRVGMVRYVSGFGHQWIGFPHPRGDGPKKRLLSWQT